MASGIYGHKKLLVTGKTTEGRREGGNEESVLAVNLGAVDVESPNSTADRFDCH